jgi:hypothetical protein
LYILLLLIKIIQKSKNSYIIEKLLKIEKLTG